MFFFFFLFVLCFFVFFQAEDGIRDLVRSRGLGDVYKRQVFKGRVKDNRLAAALGIAVTFALRFLCHFLSGWLIWEALWPNSYSYAAPVWSVSYTHLTLPTSDLV